MCVCVCACVFFLPFFSLVCVLPVMITFIQDRNGAMVWFQFADMADVVVVILFHHLLVFVSVCCK